MTRKIFLVVLLLCGAAWAQDQLTTPLQYASCATTTCAFANSVTSGNVVFIGGHSEGILTTPTDTLTQTWTLVDGRNPGGAGAWIWCTVLGSGGAETITLTGSLSFQGQIIVEMPLPFSGFTCTKDVSAVGATSSTTTTTSSITTTKNGDFALCFMSDFSSTDNPHPQVGGTFRDIARQRANDSAGLGYAYLGTNGSYSCTFHLTSGSASYVIAAFKPSTTKMITTKLPTGATSNTYSYTPQCVGGSGAYTWTASSLPSGLSINSSTGAITGTPTGGTTTPTITCTDAGTSTAASLTTAALTINSSVGTSAVVHSCGAAATNCSLGTVTSGNCLTVVMNLSQQEKMAPPTDSLSTVYRNIGAQCSDTSTVSQCINSWVGTATSTGSNTVTGSTGSGIAAVEFSNCNVSVTDVASFTANSTTPTITAASLTTLAPASEIYAAAQTSGSSTFSAGSGFTLTTIAPCGACLQGEVANEATVGTYTPTWTQSDADWEAFGMAIRPATSGVVNTNHRRAWVTQSN